MTEAERRLLPTAAERDAARVFHMRRGVLSEKTFCGLWWHHRDTLTTIWPDRTSRAEGVTCEICLAAHQEER